MPNFLGGLIIKKNKKPEGIFPRLASSLHRRCIVVVVVASSSSSSLHRRCIVVVASSSLQLLANRHASYCGNDCRDGNTKMHGCIIPCDCD